MQFLLIPPRFIVFFLGSQAFPWMVRYPSFVSPPPTWWLKACRELARMAVTQPMVNNKKLRGVCSACCGFTGRIFRGPPRPHITIEVETVISTVWIRSAKHVCHLDQLSLVVNLFGWYRVSCITAANCWISLHHSSPSRVSKNNPISKHVRMHILAILVWMDSKRDFYFEYAATRPIFSGPQLGNEKEKTTFTLPKTNSQSKWKWMIGRWVFSWDGLFSGAKLLVSGNITILKYFRP